MITTASPCRQLIGNALRRYRENLGYGLETAALVLECDRSKISRIETGQRGIRPKELRELLTEYGVSDAEQNALLTIAHGDRDSWPRGTMPDGLRDYLILESVAAEILIYDPHEVPELLQTPAYAHASGRSWFAPDRRLELALRKPRLTAVIGEQALRHPAADPAALSGQLLALADISETCPHIVLQVLPDARLAAGGAATILRFAPATGLGAAYLPGLPGLGGVCLVAQADVDSSIKAFEQLRASALSGAASARLLRELASRTPDPL